MKKRRLKSWVVTSLFVLLIAGLVGITIGVSKSIIKSMNIDNNSYVLTSKLRNRKLNQTSFQ